MIESRTPIVYYVFNFYFILSFVQNYFALRNLPFLHWLKIT
jgi:hypothetical protein